MPSVHTWSHWSSVSLSPAPGQHDGRVVHTPSSTSTLTLKSSVAGVILSGSPSGGCCLPGAFLRHRLSSLTR